MSGGHVFVTRGDMKQLVVDHVLIPMDSRRWTGIHWLSLLPPEPIGRRSGSLARVEARLEPAQRVVGVGRAGNGPTAWLVVTADDVPRDATWIAEGVLQALGEIRRDYRRTERDRPLVALPMPGTGAGGMAGRRGEVIQRLLPALRTAVADGAFDVVLVLRDQADWAAVQAQRGEDDFADLSPKQREHGDRLAEHAGHGELALFLGAGVSLSAGLPTWDELVRDLAREAGLNPDALAGVDPQDAAEVARDELGEARFRAHMVDRFTITRYTLTHGLLASLGAGSAVTTNYDTCYERAVSGAFADDERLRVLPRQRSRSGAPWLLKLHGDVEVPESIVLTRGNYLDLAARGVPLVGMVQSLLLTGHVLIVGYSLSDENVIRLARQVRQVLEQGRGRSEPVGTLLPLVEDPIRKRLWRQDLHHVPMHPRDGAAAGVEKRAAARLLEIFLDRLAWRTASRSTGSEQYLLDERYAAVTRSPADAALRASVRQFLATLPPEAKQSAGWRTIRDALSRLGEHGSG